MEYEHVPDIYVKKYYSLYDETGVEIRKDTAIITALEVLEKLLLIK
jgi:hypothetical protein